MFALGNVEVAKGHLENLLRFVADAAPNLVIILIIHLVLSVDPVLSSLPVLLGHCFGVLYQEAV